MPSIFIRINRVAFQILLAKFRLASHLFIDKTHIVARAVAGGQGKAQCVGTVFIDDFQWINAVAQGFGHFPALGIPDNTVDKYRLKR